MTTRFRGPSSIPRAPLCNWSQTIVTDRFVYVIVYANKAGRRHRYHAYALARFGLPDMEVLADEVRLAHARELVNAHDARDKEPKYAR